MKALNLPIGNGTVESAVRRVINLRLKDPRTFWYKENAEKILMPLELPETNGKLTSFTFGSITGKMGMRTEPKYVS